jgi:DNA-binding CsgD family transcriptional regulator
MRALPEIQRRCPRAHAVIVGGDEVSYGSKPRDGRTWRETLLGEVGDRLDASRVHFLGRVPYDTYLKLLQVSSAHVYLTYPFVLSWSMLEAMAAGCVVVGSSTPPVKEVIQDGENGLLVDFFDTEAIAEKIEAALAEPERREELRARVRQTVVAKFDWASVCLPRQLQLIEGLTRRSKPAITPGLIAPALQIRLTAKESEVLDWLRQGKSACEVAQILGRSEHTVKNQMRNIYGKLGARNRAQALQRASWLRGSE